MISKQILISAWGNVLMLLMLLLPVFPCLSSVEERLQSRCANRIRDFDLGCTQSGVFHQSVVVHDHDLNWENTQSVECREKSVSSVTKLSADAGPPSHVMRQLHHSTGGASTAVFTQGQPYL
jgi:hypothetical protein